MRPKREYAVLAESAFMQGRRPQQEDRHVKIADLTKAAKALNLPIDHLEQPCSFFAVYDGHRGPLCADFVAKSLHTRLLQHLSRSESPEIVACMRAACEELDAEFLAKHRTACDGCTVVMALVTGTLLSLAWLGDSRALLCRGSSSGSAVALTEDHRPQVPTEAERVRRAGGVVVNFDGAKRVAHKDFEARNRELRRAKAVGLGTVGTKPVALAVSRAMGDRDFKVPDQLLISTPSVRSFQLESSMKFMALMCDGITDVLSNEQVISELSFRRDKEPKANARQACGALVQRAYSRGSQDNLTVIMVSFQWKDGVAPDAVGCEADEFAETKPWVSETARPWQTAGTTGASRALLRASPRDALSQQPSLRRGQVRCLLCPSVTELCEEAATGSELKLRNWASTLLESRPPWAESGVSLRARSSREDGSAPSRSGAPVRQVQARREERARLCFALREEEQSWGRTVHIFRCPDHPEEPATYFCATCECPCICAECVVQKNGRHRDHEVMRVVRAHEVLKSRAGALLDEAISLEDDFAMVGDRIAWRRKDIERAAARGRASVRSAFARVRAQLNEREAELLESLDAYESGSLSSLDSGHTEYGTRLNELRRLQENLRARCRNDGDAVEALNTYSAAKAAIASLREAFRQEDFNSAPDEFVGLAGSARAELDLHAEGLASLEEAVASLCERGVEPSKGPAPARSLR
ncbi:unnamed protein product [Effrenium voratum]|nr:unnamed protein product [Effrenium voratum]